MKYELSNEVVNNILALLDRVQFNGLKEVQVANQIVDALSNPIQEDGIE